MGFQGVIERGGTNEERLYLNDLKSDCQEGMFIVRATNLPDMTDLLARHQGRYMFAASFCRPGMKVLDFPCGSGYGKPILCHTPIEYEGMDRDYPTLQYAIEYYGPHFAHGDLTNPDLTQNHYDLIVCIEGIEHIPMADRKRTVKAFWDALRPDGKLLITTPEDREGNPKNQYHFEEYTRGEFADLLNFYFLDVQIISLRDRLHNGAETNLLWGICLK